MARKISKMNKKQIEQGNDIQSQAGESEATAQIIQSKQVSIKIDHQIDLNN